MFGIAQGEAVTAANPVLQFFCRQGSLLVNPDSASYLIQLVEASSVTTVVASTVLTEDERLGYGRYVLPTGDTSGWAVGSYRCVVTYVLTSGGPSYTEVVPFEVLSPADWPNPRAFLSYISSRDALARGYAPAGTTVSTLHEGLALLSRRIEHWTQREFHPTYRDEYLDGMESPTLALREACIAISDVYDVWRTASGEQSFTYDRDVYSLYNRHLSSKGPDDRRRPRLIAEGILRSGLRQYYVWPEGEKNIKISAVFGYTDGVPPPDGVDTGIGETPRDIAFVLGAMLGRWIADPTMSNPAVYRPGSIRSFKTDMQSISFGGSGASSLDPSPWTGDPVLDGILIRHAKPISARLA